MIKVELTDAEAEALVNQVYGVKYDQAALRRAANKISAAVDQGDGRGSVAPVSRVAAPSPRRQGQLHV